VQHELLGTVAFRAQEALQLQSRVQLCVGEQPGLRLEGYAADLRLDFTRLARFLLLRLVPQPEFDRGNAGGRIAQRAQLKQPAAQLEPVQD
jgi:hypothetical protein